MRSGGTRPLPSSKMPFGLPLGQHLFFGTEEHEISDSLLGRNLF